jgi:predicted alpha/beta-hydrolase family hydrolase
MNFVDNRGFFRSPRRQCEFVGWTEEDNDCSEHFVAPIQSEEIPIAGDGIAVSGLLLAPPLARACYVLAHGETDGMNHPFMESVAVGLADRGIATLRYQFPYMERGTRLADPPPIAHATVRAAVAEAHRALPDIPLIAGGKSFGGRMTSEAQAEAPLTAVRGIAFLGFPLHPAGKLGQDRAAHLFEVDVPLLLLQGTRDPLAALNQLEPVCRALGSQATLKLFVDADHSFRVPAQAERNETSVRAEMLDALLKWIYAVIIARG